MFTYFPKNVNSEYSNLDKMTQCLTMKNFHSCDVIQSMAKDAMLHDIMTDNSCILNPCHTAG